MAVKSKTEGTTTNLGNEQYSATDAEAAAFDLNPYLLDLMWNEPFYSKILRGITKVKTEAIPTAGVMVKDGDITMLWNPKFLASLVKDEGAAKIRGLNIHECLHLVWDHCVSRKHEPHIIWNYATDCAINSRVSIELLPECGIIPGKAFKELTEEQKEKMGPERVEKYDRMSTFVEALPGKKSSEWYFARFMENDDIRKDLEEQGQPGQPGGDGEGLSIPGNMDNHEGWGDEDDMSESDREMVKGKVKQVLKDAVKEADRKNSWGSVGAELRGELRKMVSNDIPWQSILKRFVGFSRRANRSTSYSRIHSTMGRMCAGARRNFESSVAVYIDQSGSVSNGELELLFAELRNLAKKTEFTTYHFDTAVDEKSKQIWKRSKTPNVHRTRCGGTCFVAPTKHANKHKTDFDGYLVLTDGFAPDPGPSRLRRGWVITPDGKAQDWMKRGQDFVIEMKWPETKQAAA
jgi:predicted metal-dependent peptidase